MYRETKTTTDGWEIIGWDPVQQQIRSWIFDSNGGFGESAWVNNGEDWLIRASNVLPDGSRSTAENAPTKVDDNKFTWESQNRTLNGEPQPSLQFNHNPRYARRTSGSLISSAARAERTTPARDLPKSAGNRFVDKHPLEGRPG